MSLIILCPLSDPDRQGPTQIKQAIIKATHYQSPRVPLPSSDIATTAPSASPTLLMCNCQALDPSPLPPSSCVIVKLQLKSLKVHGGARGRISQSSKYIL